MDYQLEFPAEGDKVYFRSKEGQIVKHLYTYIRCVHCFHCFNQCWSIEDQYGNMIEIRPYGEEWAQVLENEHQNVSEAS